MPRYLEAVVVDRGVRVEPDDGDVVGGVDHSVVRRRHPAVATDDACRHGYSVVDLQEVRRTRGCALQFEFRERQNQHLDRQSGQCILI